MIARRTFIKATAAGTLGLGAALSSLRRAFTEDRALYPPALPSGTQQMSFLQTLPGKRPLIKRTFRPPNYETPISYFNEPITPNDVFFVRYHLSEIPEVDAANWRLVLGGDALGTPREFSLEDLGRDFEPVELTAVCQCAGNRRGFSEPHVPGVEWGSGAMGNARWKGVRLRDLLHRAGLEANALEVVVNGADKGAIEQTPDFVKSIPVWKALDENTLIAFGMNGEPLPHWNGFPARLVVPGWSGTYWVKHVTNIDVVSAPFDGFWMSKAYRIPNRMFPVVQRFTSQEADANTPITEMVVNSLITNLAQGTRIARGKDVEVKGIAWDGGYGISLVEVTADGGRTWRPADLGTDMGRFSWRQWAYRFEPDVKGTAVIAARASNRAGTTQAPDLLWNPAGYHNNVVQRIGVSVV
jgi:DMSO/TMAO reductase YedYZ molybdopterin-dependent catalytic subunit